VPCSLQCAPSTGGCRSTLCTRASWPEKSPSLASSYRSLTPKFATVLLLLCFALLVAQASRFRRLVGTMSPPDDSADEAEIYVEGTRKMVNGFVRWCQKGDVGLNQVVTVLEVLDEDPTGLYEKFYVKSE
jgi:acylphosphatase